MSGSSEPQNPIPRPAEQPTKSSQSFSPPRVSLSSTFGILVVLTIIGLLAHEEVGRWGAAICPEVRTVCHHIPYVIGFALLLILWALYRLFTGDWNALETVRGKDNRWSTSKCQFFLWTVVSFFSYGGLLAGRIG